MFKEDFPGRPWVVWLDDEPNLLLAERYDLSDMRINVARFDFLGSAYDWILKQDETAVRAKAYVVDAMMPHRDDRRFRTADGTPGGAVLCHQLSEQPVWNTLKAKVVLYTRLPAGQGLDLVDRTARAIGVPFVRKTRASRIAVELIKAGKVNLDG